MKSKAAVVALCVCVILAILGVVLGKSPALENTELPHSVSEEILSAEETSSESKASSRRGFDTCKSHDAQRRI